MDEPTTPAHGSDTEDDRVALQAILGQIHGLLDDAIRHIEEWCIPAARAEITRAYETLGPAFGELQAELNSGRLDTSFGQIGLAGEQLEPKRRGLLRAIGRSAKNFAIRPLKTALRWSGTIVGSLSREIPGGEVIGEFVQVVQNAIEEHEEARASG